MPSLDATQNPPTADPALLTGGAGDDGGLLTGQPDPAAPADPGAAPADPADPNAPPADPNTPADPNAPAGDDSETAGAPEAYEDFTAPEGVTLDPETTESFKTFAKELNLPQAKAQTIVDMGTALVERTINQLVEGFQATRSEWLTQSKAAFDAPALAKAKKGLETFGTPELTTFLRDEQLENHPEIIRLLARVGEVASEDTFVATGGAVQSGGKPLADRMFPAHNQ